MANKNQKKCLYCGEVFSVDVRNRGRQQYCSKSKCQRGSKAASQRRWLHKPENRNYFRDADNSARVRRWQSEHPGYWRNTTRSRRRALQETLPAKRLTLLKKEATAPPHTPPALQEVFSAPGPLLVGLLATLSDSVLQEDIAQTSRRLVQIGQDILSGSSSHDPQTSAAP
jgi:hypothetical protein